MTTVSGYITRPLVSGSPGNLAICNGVIDLRMNEFDPGTLTPRYEWADSDWATGAVDVSGGAEDNPTMTAVWIVKGTSHSNLNTNVGLLVAALRQNKYAIRLSFDSQNNEWTCFRAQMTQPFTSIRERRYWAEVTSLIPRHPIPVYGPF